MAPPLTPSTAGFAQLRRTLKSLGLSAGGTRLELAERLQDYMQDHSVPNFQFDSDADDNEDATPPREAPATTPSPPRNRTPRRGRSSSMVRAMDVPCTPQEMHISRLRQEVLNRGHKPWSMRRADLEELLESLMNPETPSSPKTTPPRSRTPSPSPSPSISLPAASTSPRSTSPNTIQRRTVSTPSSSASPSTSPKPRRGRSSSTTMMMREVKSDAVDFYNTVMQYIVVPLMLLYIAFTFYNTHVSEAVDGTEDEYKTIARDSLLQMTVSEEFPKWAQRVHAFAGISLVLFCFFQKRLVYEMAQPGGYANWKDSHRYVGYFLIVLIGMMTIGGYAMGSVSLLDNFSYFIVLFALPWALWFILLLWSVQSMTNIATHRLLGNMVLKSCIAVPLSRVMGAYLQRSGWGEASGYYTGILATTVLIGLWQVYELYLWVKAGRD